MNGKALSSGIQLSGMEASDMLDLLHFYFEEDNIYGSEEALMSRSKIRESVYNDLYGVQYKYKVENRNTKGNNSSPTANFDLPVDEEFDTPLKPFDPLAGPTKSYIPPTNFDPEAPKPFGNVLDAPMN